MIDMDLIFKAWPIILSMVVLIGWTIRQEARITTIEKRTEEIKKDHKDVEKTLLDKFDNLHSTLHRLLESIGEIKGKINHN